jgi:alkylhydroperoxidase/carboxymuconolactone decarboxylase family protein YurZ
MSDQAIPQAWLKLPSEEEIRQLVPAGANPYDFGFITGMQRLVMAHMGIAPMFFGLFARIMFGPSVLSRQEREMIAAVAAAAQDCEY